VWLRGAFFWDMMLHHNPEGCKIHAYFCKYNQYTNFNWNMITANFKICFHCFRASPTPFSSPLPYLQSVKLPQTLPHNRHNLSTATLHHLPKPSHRMSETVRSSGGKKKNKQTKPTIWRNSKRWQSTALKQKLIHYEHLYAPHLSTTLDILQQSIPSNTHP